MKDNDIDDMYQCRPIYLVMRDLRFRLNTEYDMSRVLEYNTSAQYGGNIMAGIEDLIRKL